MEITPRELRDVEIREAFRGYSRDEVNELLERAAATLEATNERVQQMSERLSTVQSETGHTRETEDILHRTLLLAQRAADEAVNEAGAKARQMVDDAEIQSRRLIADAEADARRRGESERRRLEEEVLDLATRRDALLADVEALTRFEADYRDRMVRALEADLTALRSRPPASPGTRPEPSDVQLPTATATPAAPAPAVSADMFTRRDLGAPVAVGTGRAGRVPSRSPRRRRHRLRMPAHRRTRRRLLPPPTPRSGARVARRRVDPGGRRAVAVRARRSPGARDRVRPARGDDRNRRAAARGRRPKVSRPRCSTTTRSSRRCVKQCTTRRRSAPATRTRPASTRSSTATTTGPASATCSAAAASYRSALDEQIGFGAPELDRDRPPADRRAFGRGGHRPVERLHRRCERLAHDPLAVLGDHPDEVVVGGVANGDAVADLEPRGLAEVVEHAAELAGHALGAELVVDREVERDRERAVLREGELLVLLGADLDVVGAEGDDLTVDVEVVVPRRLERLPHERRRRWRRAGP